MSGKGGVKVFNGKKATCQVKGLVMRARTREEGGPPAGSFLSSGGGGQARPDPHIRDPTLTRDQGQLLRAQEANKQNPKFVLGVRLDFPLKKNFEGKGPGV